MRACPVFRELAPETVAAVTGPSPPRLLYSSPPRLFASSTPRTRGIPPLPLSGRPRASVARAMVAAGDLTRAPATRPASPTRPFPRPETRNPRPPQLLTSSTLRLRRCRRPVRRSSPSRSPERASRVEGEGGRRQSRLDSSTPRVGGIMAPPRSRRPDRGRSGQDPARSVLRWVVAAGVSGPTEGPPPGGLSRRPPALRVFDFSTLLRDSCTSRNNQPGNRNNASADRTTPLDGGEGAYET